MEIWHFGSIPVKREILENLDWYMVGNWYSCLFLVGNSVMYCICHLFFVGKYFMGLLGFILTIQNI